MPTPVHAKPSTRRRRRFGGGRRKKEKKLVEGSNGSGFFAHGVNRSLGAVAWLWHTTMAALRWSTPRIQEKAGARGAGGWSGDGAVGTSSSGPASVLLVVGAVASAVVVLMFRAQRKRGRDQTRPQPSTAPATPTAEQDDAYNSVQRNNREKPKEREHVKDGEKFAVDRPTHDPVGSWDDQTKRVLNPLRNGGGSLRWSPQQQKMNTGPVAGASGERRISLYDVLTGEAPLTRPREEMPDAAGARANSVAGSRTGVSSHGLRCGGGGGGGVGGSGIVPLSGVSRRASIFDRIADVVFNEEQEQNPVDPISVRGELADEFSVSFREGAMGMTLSMDPESRDAVVGNIVEQGQAFRAGVQTGDFVIGVAEHTVSSFGTVLAFMNIMGRPIELHFRKSGKGGGSSGAPISVSNDGAVGGDGGRSAAIPEGVRAAAVSGVSKSGSIRERRRGERRESSSRTFTGAEQRTPISPRSTSKVSGLSGLGRAVTSSDSDFNEKMEHGVLVTKYGKKGAAAQRVLYLDSASMSVAWRDLDSSPPGHRRSNSLTNILKGKGGALALAGLVEVVAGDEPDPSRPSATGSAMLREHCDESLLERSFALQFKERSLEITCDSHAVMRLLVAGFRDLQKKYGQ